MVTTIMTIIHTLIYVSLAGFIPVFADSLTLRRNLLWTIVALGASFPVFQILNHFLSGMTTRILTGIAGFWFTLSLYLFGLFLMIWGLKAGLVIGQVSETGSSSILWYATLSAMTGAFLFTFYGFINALSIQTTRVDIALKNLPKSWQGKTLLHVSDVHLGGVWGPGRIRQVTAIARREKPEAIVITGDLFDGGSGALDEFVPALAELAQTNPPGGIYFTSGNHERYASYNHSITAVKKAGIRLLENDVVEINGIQIVGIQFPDLMAMGKEIIEDFDLTRHPVYKKSRPTILLFHTPTNFEDGKINLADIQRKAYIKPDTEFLHARALGIDLQLSGHTHAGQFFPLEWITKKIYKGYHYGLQRSGDFQIYISSGAGTWGPPIRHLIPSEVALLRLTKKT